MINNRVPQKMKAADRKDRE